ncbi:MAG: hypothetical protein H7832_01080 [Magnetococcus sp. DMHC-6]
MERFHEKFTLLKKKLQTESDLGVPFEYFMSNFAENMEFMRGSVITQHKSLTNIIHTIAKEQFHQQLKTESCLLQKMANGPNLIHGACQIPERLVVLFFIEEVKMGMVAMIHFSDRSMVHYYRFTVIQTPNGQLTWVPGDPTVLH